MLTHQTGGIKGTRLGSVMVVHTIPITFADLTAVAKKLLTIAPVLNPSPGIAVFEPIAYEISAIIDTAFNPATSEVLAVGANATSYNDSIATFDLTGAAGTNATQAANPIKLCKADTDIFAVPTIVGAQATAGLAYVIIKVYGVNVNAPTNQGS